MSERQTLSWAACDALASQGKKPSIGLVREWTIATTGAKKGSDGDVQRDISLWYADLLKLKQAQGIANLPAPVTALARDLWQLAVDCAGDSLEVERQALVLEKQGCDRAVEAARAEAAKAADEVADFTSRLAIVQEALAGRDETIKRLEASLLENRALLLAKDERIEGLSAELARKSEEHASGLAERDGLRKHALLQIDQACGESRHWKAEFERVDHESKSTVEVHRRNASALSTELATANGRLTALEEALAHARERVRELEIMSRENGTDSPLSLRAKRPIAPRAKKIARLRYRP